MIELSPERKNKPPDDGFRYMPKLRCPYGNHRFGDVPDVNFRNTVLLLKYEPGGAYGYGDAICVCPVCRQRVVIHLKTVQGQTKVFAHAVAT